MNQPKTQTDRYVLRLKSAYQPKLSIVLPTYNRLKYLKLCIPTILGQSFTDFELIIVNDGSTDGTEAYIKSLRDSRIIYVRWANKGEYAATNAGWRLAKGQYLTWIHSDDTWPKDTLKKRIGTLEKNPEIDFTHGNIEHVDEDGKSREKVTAFDGAAKTAFLEYLKPIDERIMPYLIHYPSIMIRRDFLTRTGFLDETLPCSGDFDWLLRALRLGKTLKTPGFHYYYRSHLAQRSKAERKDFSRRPVDELIYSRYRKYLPQ